jgi:hypothetical protein
MEAAVPGKRRLVINVAAVARAMGEADRSHWERLLDVHTGELLTLPRSALEAAAEGTPVDAVAPEAREALPQAKVVARAKPGRFIGIPHRPPPDVYDVMQRFVASVDDPDLRRSLERALGGHAPFRRFKEVLADDVAEEARWEEYGETVRQLQAREWLEDLGIELTDG